MDNTYQDGWQVIPVSQVFDSIRLLVTAGKEQDRLIDIMTDLLGGQTHVKYFLNEEHSYDKNVDAERIRKELQNLKTDIVYDSNWLRNIPDSGYNCISIGSIEDDGSGHGELYVVFSSSHISGASALSEYFMFEV
jgi:hypothetical protein|tara:strand:- start:1617 stop:2021 length:405 start_codon:yes stop_codon:yes gene_type:complete